MDCKRGFYDEDVTLYLGIIAKEGVTKFFLTRLPLLYELLVRPDFPESSWGASFYTGPV